VITNGDDIMSKKVINFSIIVVLIFIAFYILAEEHYLLFHTSTELFSIIIVSVVFIIAYHSRRYIKSQYIIFMGVSYLFIAIIDFFHTMTFSGMPIFTHLKFPANQLWIAARYFEAFVLLFAFTILNYIKKVNILRLFIAEAIITILLLSSILVFEIFPVCYVEGEGLTTFKIVSEYVISFIMILALISIYINRERFTKHQFTFYSLAILFTILSELLFTFYISNYGISNLFGHYFKVMSFIFIYQIIVNEGLNEPMSLIFKELEESKKKLETQAFVDELTKIPNRRSLFKMLDQVWKLSVREEREMSLLMIDIDDFKLYNDNFGHQQGDVALYKIAQAISSKMMRPLDACGRYGGEEFLVILDGCDKEGCQRVAKNIHEAIMELNLHMDDVSKKIITVSIGYVSFTPKRSDNFETFVKYADDQLYLAKQSNKNCTRGIEI